MIVRLRAQALLIFGVLMLAMAPARAGFVVELHDVVDRKAVFGTVESLDVTVARARIPGTVRALAVDEGSRVEEGQKIAEIRDEKLPLRLAALDAEIKSLAAQQTLARTELERAQELRRRGTISQAKLDEARTQADVVAAQIAARRAERAVVEQQIRDGEVRAPAGRVLKVHVVEGSAVQPGEPVAEIATETYVLRLRLPERHARFIRVGDPVLVGQRGLDPAPEDQREGRIRQVYPEMENGQVVADVEVAGLGDFFVGERTRVWVATGTRKALVVPADYLTRRLGLTFARLENGQEVVVQPGLPVDSTVEGGVEVLSGLNPGDVLVRP